MLNIDLIYVWTENEISSIVTPHAFKQYKTFWL